MPERDALRGISNSGAKENALADERAKAQDKVDKRREAKKARRNARIASGESGAPIAATPDTDLGLRLPHNNGVEQPDQLLTRVGGRPAISPAEAMPIPVGGVSPRRRRGHRGR